MDWQQFTADFHFLRPEFLWFLPVLALVLIFQMLRGRRAARWVRAIDPRLRPWVVLDPGRKRSALKQLLLGFTAGFLILAAAGPAWRKTMAPRKEWTSTAVILLDASSSMLVADTAPNRLERAKFKISDLLDEDPALPTALVAYAGTAHRVLPPTRDYRLVTEYLEPLAPGVMPLAGSRLDRALEEAGRYDEPGSYTAVLIYSDSPEAADIDTLDAFLKQREGDTDVFYIPFATAAGGNIVDSRGRNILRDGDTILSRRNEIVLDRLEDLEQVEVIPPVLDGTDVILLSEKLRNRLSFLENLKEEEENWQDEGPWFLIPGLLFALLWFRRGFRLLRYSLATLTAIAFLTGCGGDTDLRTLWFSDDNLGDRAYEAEDYIEAAELYDSAFQRGNAYYRSGEYALAYESYRKDSSPASLYNSALASIQLGNYSEALELMRRAGELDPGLPDIDNRIRQLEQWMADNPGIVEAAGEEAAASGEDAEVDDNQDDNNDELPEDRESETVESDVRMADEGDLPDSEAPPVEPPDPSTKYLIRAISPEPSEFLRRKFLAQARGAYPDGLDEEENPW